MQLKKHYLFLCIFFHILEEKKNLNLFCFHAWVFTVLKYSKNRSQFSVQIKLNSKTNHFFLSFHK